MSIESFEGFHTPVCDICSAELETENDFHDAVQAKKDAGWRSRQVDGEWEDLCPECQESERQKYMARRRGE